MDVDAIPPPSGSQISPRYSDPLRHNAPRPNADDQLPHGQRGRSWDQNHLSDPALPDIKLLVGLRPPSILGEHPGLQGWVLAAMNLPPSQQSPPKFRCDLIEVAMLGASSLTHQAATQAWSLPRSFPDKPKRWRIRPICAGARGRPVLLSLPAPASASAIAL